MSIRKIICKLRKVRWRSNELRNFYKLRSVPQKLVWTVGHHPVGFFQVLLKGVEVIFAVKNNFDVALKASSRVAKKKFHQFLLNLFSYLEPSRGVLLQPLLPKKCLYKKCNTFFPFFAYIHHTHKSFFFSIYLTKQNETTVTVFKNYKKCLIYI